MAKRFTDTEKWNKQFIRGLQGAYKLLWLYICDECNVAGIWEVDIDVARIKTGSPKISVADAVKKFSNKIVVFDNGKKWFIPSFIEFQYGQLSENNRAHTKAIFLLKKFNLINDNLVIKPLTSPLQGAKDMVEEKEEDKEKEKDMEQGGEPEKLTLLFNSQHFIKMWERWKAYKSEQHKFTYKSISTEQAAINELIKLSGGYENIAVDIILQSIASGWKGFFALKKNTNGNSANKTHNNAGYSDLEARLDGSFKKS